MGKKLKSTYQLSLLQKYFANNPTQWPKPQVITLAKKAGLSRSQVYKWLWDQRNLKRQEQAKIQYYSSKMEIDVQNQSFIEMQKEQRMLGIYKKILIKTQNLNTKVQVPLNIEFTTLLFVPLTTSKWAVQILKKYGMYLTKLEKPDKIQEVMGCNPVFIQRFEEIKQQMEEKE